MNRCRACSKPIRWARTTNDRAIPLDAEPTDDGNVVLEYPAGSSAGGTGAPVAHVLGKFGLPLELAHLAEEPRYMPHHATCEKWSR